MGHSPELWIAYPPWMWPALATAFVALALGTLLVQGLRPKYRRLYGAKALLHAAKFIPLSIPTWLYQLTALVLLLLPWWWVSVLLSYGLVTVAGIPSTPTAVFLVGLAGVYAWFLAKGFVLAPANHRFEESADADERPPATPKRVAVIGAGMAGLVAAKELKEEGHEVVVFERTDGWGGVWASSKKRGGRAWGSTLTSTGALNTTFSDSPFPVLHPENGEVPLHYTRQQFMEMLEAYEARYGVFADVLRPRTEVTSMTLADDGAWRIVSTGPDGPGKTERFDAVTVCTGLNHEPWTPPFDGAGTFDGPEIHVDEYDYDDPGAYRGKTVLVVGVGETSADIAKDLADGGARKIYVAPRGSTITLARSFASVPPDYNENRVTYSGPMANRWGILLSGLATMLTNVISPTRVRAMRFGPWYGLARLHETIKDFPAILGSVNVTKSDNLWKVLDSGVAEQVKAIEAITPGGARLSNGEELDVDAIVYCTGYRTKNTFLSEVAGRDLQAEPLVAEDLYKLMLHPELPNLAVLGFARGMIGAITLSTELQARWWALLLSEKRPMPSEEERKAHVAYLKGKVRRFSRATRTTMTYASSLARNDIGCEPDMFDLFRRDRRLWWQVWNGAICAAHFRLHGVRAKPDLAREQLTMPGSLHAEDYIDAVDVAYNIIPLAIVTIPLWAVLERLVPSFFTRSALSCYS